MALKKPEKAYKNLEFLNSPAARELRILAEFVEPRSRFKKHKVVDTVVVFGSARLMSKEDAEKNLDQVKNNSKSTPAEVKKAEIALKNSRYYEDAVEFSRRITSWAQENFKHENRFAICTGGGPGIMEAGNKGAHLAGGKSIGLNISLPFEQFANPYIEDDLNFEFHYFFMRKFWFAYLAKAIVIFPGGFGTLDELAEILTLVQTGKIKKGMKILIYDKAFWDQILNFDALVENGVISPEDQDLYTICESVDELEKELITHLESIKDKPKLM
jgi:uncharacterized protein (TIGR00730 family)